MLAEIFLLLSNEINEDFFDKHFDVKKIQTSKVRKDEYKVHIKYKFDYDITDFFIKYDLMRSRLNEHTNILKENVNIRRIA